MTRQPPGRPETSKPVAEHVAAWNAHDVDRGASLCAADGSYGEFGRGTVMLGVRQIRRYLAAVFSAVPDLTKTLTGHPICDRERVLFKWVMTGTLEVRFAGLPPTGDRFKVRGATALVTAGNDIVRRADYFSLRDIAIDTGREEDRSPNLSGIRPVVLPDDPGLGQRPLTDEDNIGYGE